jgi:hypothetical protein
MIGLCAVLAPDPSTDPVKYLGRAFDHYSRLPGRQVGGGWKRLGGRVTIAQLDYLSSIIVCDFGVLQ